MFKIKLAYISGQISGYRSMGYKKRANTLVRQTAQQLIKDLKNNAENEIGNISLPNGADFKVSVDEGKTYGPVVSADVVGMSSVHCFDKEFKPNDMYDKMEAILRRTSNELKTMVEDLGLKVDDFSYKIASPAEPGFYSLFRSGYSGMSAFVMFSYPDQTFE